MSWLRARVRVSVDALEHLVGGLGTSVLALGVLLWVLVVAVASLAGVGLPLAQPALAGVRSVADRERGRLPRWGPTVLGPGPVPGGLRAAIRDPFVRRELAWLPLHAIFGFLAGILGLSLPLSAVQDVTFPLWYRF